MAIIKSVRGFDPKFGDNCYLADNATIIGDVTMGDDCSIWFGAVLRGDVNTITLGNKVNIQDNAVIHTLYQKSKTKIGDNVSVGHNAVIHGATIEDNCLIGMGAVVLDNAVVGHGSVVAAGSVVLTGPVIEPGSICRRASQKGKERRPGTKQNSYRGNLERVRNVCLMV